MKDLSTSVRPEVAESEILLGGSSPKLFEKRHLKEIVMNGEAHEPVTEHKISSSTDELKAVVEIECDTSEENGDAELELISISLESSKKQSEHKTNGDSVEVVNLDSEAQAKSPQEAVPKRTSSAEPKEVVTIQDDSPGNFLC